MLKSKNRKISLGILLCICTAFFACGIFAFPKTITAQAGDVSPNVYWKYDSATSTLSIGGTYFDGAQSIKSDDANFIKGQVPWQSYKSQLTTVNFNSPVTPLSTMWWFNVCKNLTTVNNIGNLDTSNVTNMQAMFTSCENLTNLDVSCWDTSNVTNMTYLFNGCTGLTNLDVSNWNTSNVTNMSDMFGSSGLTSLDLSNFDTSKVTTMEGMFAMCKNLSSVDLSSFNTENVTNMGGMFNGCTSMKTLDLSSFDATNLNAANAMIKNLPLDKLKLSDTLAEKLAGFASKGTSSAGIILPLYNAMDGNTSTTSESGLKAGGYFKTPHTHDYKLTSTKNSTCKDAGSKLYTCSEDFCGDTYTQTLPLSSEHVYVAGDVIDPTCTAQGYTNYTCSVCGHKKKDDYQPVTAHVYEDVTTDPTCTEKGYTTYTCPDCDKTYVGDEVNALGHDWGAWYETKAATEDEEGEEKRECQRDNCSAEETQPIPQLNHVHVEVTDEAKDPTCTETGLTAGKHCSACNHVIVAQEIVPALGHTLGDAATCTEPQKCTVCNTELAAALGHDYKAAEGGVAPTCTEAGSGKIVCTRCNDEQSGDTIPALGHDWATEWSKDETNHWHECNRCDEKNDNVAHTYEWIITKDPTEEETGLKENLCTVCKDKDGEEELAKLVVDDNGSVGDLPKLPDNQNYDLEIAVKESDSLYNIPGITKGYKVELFVVDGENRTEYDNNKQVTLMLVIPEGMEDEFTLYCRHGDILEPVDPATYTINGKSVTIRTTLPNEYVFNAPAPEEPSTGIPWWVWLIVGLVAAALFGIFIIIIAVAKKKKNDNTPPDNGELLSRMDSQEQKIDELLTRSDDGGFNTPVELDENGNVIFK